MKNIIDFSVCYRKETTYLMKQLSLSLKETQQIDHGFLLKLIGVYDR